MLFLVISSIYVGKVLLDVLLVSKNLMQSHLNQPTMTQISVLII